MNVSRAIGIVGGAAPAAAAAAALDAFISAVCGLGQETSLQLLAPLLLFAFTIAWLLSLNGRLYLKQQFRKDFASAVRKIAYARSKGSTLLGALSDASRGESDPRVRDLFAYAGRRVRMGGSLSEALSELDEARGALPSGVRAHDAGDDLPALSEAYCLDAERKQADVESSLQAYSTLNMFVSTIAPSMLSFALVGSSILSGSGSNLLLFSLALLVAAPTAYAAVGTLMNRRLLG